MEIQIKRVRLLLDNNNRNIVTCNEHLVSLLLEDYNAVTNYKDLDSHLNEQLVIVYYDALDITERNQVKHAMSDVNMNPHLVIYTNNFFDDLKCEIKVDNDNVIYEL